MQQLRSVKLNVCDSVMSTQNLKAVYNFYYNVDIHRLIFC